jgi:hypothetical protein
MVGGGGGGMRAKVILLVVSAIARSMPAWHFLPGSFIISNKTGFHFIIKESRDFCN